MIVANDGCVISVMGNMISCSNGETYTLMGSTLFGPRGVMSMNVRSVDEAVGIVLGAHGGRRM